MGMFDWVYCEVELPDGYDPGPEGFQTKDFENIMTTIKITAEGRLEIFLYEYEHIGDYDPGWTKGELIPRFERVNERWVEYCERDGSLFHGTFNFYDYDVTGFWHEYVAKFDDGKLREILLVPDRFAERQD